MIANATGDEIEPRKAWSNDYRLVAAVDFEKSIVWIKWIGAHKDYDAIDVKGVRYGR